VAVGFGVFGGITVALPTLSSRLRRRTPEVLRPAERTDLVSMRMILPNWLMTIISVVSSTRSMLVTLPILKEVFMLMTLAAALTVTETLSFGIAFTESASGPSKDFSADPSYLSSAAELAK
jgi:hypothetical protein